MRRAGLTLIILCFGIGLVLAASDAASAQDRGRDRLSHRLRRLADEHDRGGEDAADALATLEGVKVRRGARGGRLVPVILETREGGSSVAVADAVEALGGSVDAVSRSYLRALVPFRLLRRLDDIADVRVARLPTPAKALTPGLGPRVSESVGLTNAAALQTATPPNLGTGVKVAVIDLGFSGLSAAKTQGELPAGTVGVDFSGTGLEASADGPHGVGVAEHVMDMAPGATLYCIKVGDEVDLQNAADYCATNGIRVANHSVGWVISSYYDGTGPINAIVNESSANDGVFWAVAAGNDKRRHWRGPWSDPNGNNDLNFSGTDERLNLTSASGVAYIFLNWNQYGSSVTDLDLRVYRNGTTLVASSLGVQNGPQEPSEVVAFNYSAGSVYTIRVNRYSGPTAGLDITLFSFYNDLEYAVAAASLMDPANAPGAFSVGAIDYHIYAGANPDTEPYSSEGPTTDGRLKPDIVAPDATTSYTYGPSGATGTSFSSPTVAGAAALLLAQDSTLTPAQLADQLRALAIDVGPPGPDPEYGAGKLRVDSIVAPNAAPVASPQSVTTAEETAKAIVLAATDPDSGPGTLAYAIVAGPTHGALTGTPPAVTYTPATDYFGPDSFTFKANDGAADSNVAAVSIDVTNVNDAPVANGQSKTTPEDTAVAITLTASDPDGPTGLSYAVVSGPTSGTLSGTAPSLTYTPAENYDGSDSFTFEVSDGTLSSQASVSITVTAVNDAPTADDLSTTTAEDTAVGVTLSGADIEGSSLSFIVVSGPANGSLSGTAPNLTYTPDGNFNGSDGFTYRTNDGQLDSAPATVSIAVDAVNDAPVANGQSVTVATGVSSPIALTGSDVDGDPLAFVVVAGPSNGTLSGTAPNVTYTSAPGYLGADSFTFTVGDGVETSAPATISISVTGNVAPVASDLEVTTAEDTAVGIVLAATDADGGPGALAYQVVSPPASGVLSGTAPNLTYTPAAEFSGSDSFTYRANDGAADSNTATVLIAVTAVDDPPVASGQSLSTPWRTAVAITLAATDIDSGALTYAVVSGPANGTLSGTAPNLTYTPTGGFSGGDSFTFRASDATSSSNTATVSISVSAPVTVATENWESGGFSGGTGWTGAWVRSGDNGNVTGGGPHGGSRHARLRSSTGLLTRDVNVAGRSQVYLRVWVKTDSFENGDTAAILVSTNGGASYTTLRTFVNGEDTGTYGFYELALPAGASVAKVRFDANMSGTGDFYYIDDISVVAAN